MGSVSRRRLLGGSFLAYAWTLSPLALAAPASPAPADTDWRAYGGDLGATRYAPLAQIDGTNFNDLEVARRFKPDNLGANPEYRFQSTPLVIGGVLYTTAGARRDVVALDAKTGEMLWLYRLDEGRRAQASPRKLSGRGVSYWTDGKSERILFVTTGYQLVALDAKTGLPDPAFGKAGVVDLKDNLDQDFGPLKDDIALHATPCVVKDVVVVGAAHSAGSQARQQESVRGFVRAFDVRTGKLKWVFHTTPNKGEFGADTWLGDVGKSGNAGVWAQITADPDLDLVYLPVEMPTGDFWGGHRPGSGLFGESIVAVDLNTGRRKWHYQTVHHGLWDNDIPAAPMLFDIPMGGRMIKALAVPTKQSFLFVFDRTNGKPIWPIVERKVPKGDTPGEWYAPTQPIPTKPAPFDMQGVRESDLIDFTPELRAQALELVKNYRTGSIYTPPAVWNENGPWGTIMIPGVTGGANWGGGAYDPETHRLYVYSKTEPQIVALYRNANPKVTFDYVTVFNGAPPGVKPPRRGGIRAGDVEVDGLPLVKPPWGRISAIDMTKGDFAWQIAHGETPDAVTNHPKLKGLKIPRTGRAGILGVLVTKSLVICGEAGFGPTPNGKRGAMLRAYDKATGEEKGAVYMPAPQSGSPMTYMAGGRQYLVVAVSGGDYSGELIAYRLPRA